MTSFKQIDESIGRTPPLSKDLTPTHQGQAAAIGLTLIERLAADSQGEKKRLEETKAKQLRPAFSVMG